MAEEHDFREPVFVRDDDTITVRASVVVWGERLGGVSVRIEGMGGSVLINAADWPLLVGCVNQELALVE